MDYKLQVVTVPVSDVDQASAFYTQQAGSPLDVDYHPASGFRVVQLTPPGSACSVQIDAGLTDAALGSLLRDESSVARLILYPSVVAEQTMAVSRSGDRRSARQLRQTVWMSNGAYGSAVGGPLDPVDLFVEGGGHREDDRV